MTKALAVVAVVVASTGIARADATTVAARLEEAVTDRDVDAVQTLLADTVAIDHTAVRFANVACDKRGKTVARRVLAACLVKEGFAPTVRRTATPDATLVTFASGLEVEIAVRDGVVHALSSPAREPALSLAALEARRTAGTMQLDAIVAARLTQSATAWLDVCVDAAGKVTSSVRAGDPHAGRVFRTAIADWRFRTFTHRGTRIATCTPIAFTFPASKVAAVDTIPAHATPATTPVATPRTASELVALYRVVGKKLSTLDRDASAPLFARYRHLQVNEMLRDDDARQRAAIELLAIDAAIATP